MVDAAIGRVPSREVGPADIHRLACFLLEDPGAESHAEQDKSFTAQPPVIDRESGRAQLVFASLDDDLAVVDRVERRLLPRDGKGPNLGRGVPLSDARVRVSGTSWIELVASPGVTRVSVETVSPVTFSRSGVSYPLPDPRLMMSQMIRRWNAHVSSSSLVIPEEAAREIASRSSLQWFEINSSKIELYKGRFGFEGAFTMMLHSEDPLLRKAFAALFEFSTYAGIGALTTHGLGAIRLVD